MYGYIYKTTNLVNGKIYIGQHKADKFDNSYYGSGKYLKRAINKYGISNFVCEVIVWCESKSELDELEIYYIDKFNSRDSDIGYNISYGGDGGDLVTCLSEEEHQKFVTRLSELSKGGIIGNKGRHLSEIHKQRIGNGNRGKVHSEEWKKKHDDAIRGREPWNKGLTLDDPRVAKYARKCGEFHHTEETKKRISEHTRGIKKQKVSDSMRGRKWMHKNDVSIMVKPADIQQYKAQGYVEGRGKLK